MFWAKMSLNNLAGEEKLVASYGSKVQKLWEKASSRLVTLWQLFLQNKYFYINCILLTKTVKRISGLFPIKKKKSIQCYI